MVRQPEELEEKVSESYRRQVMGKISLECTETLGCFKAVGL